MRKWISTLVLLLLGLSIWYFLIKDYNYLVRFQANHNAGTVYSTINNWLLDRLPDIDSVAVVAHQYPERIVQEVYIKDSILSI